MRFLKSHSLILLALILCMLYTGCSDNSSGTGGGEVEVREPPFQGTVFISEDIITTDDESKYQNLSFTGRDNRVVYDEEAGGNTSKDVYLFDVTFSNGHTAELLGDQAFANADSVAAVAEKYCIALGRMPNVMLNSFSKITMNKSSFRFQGNVGKVIIYTEYEGYDDGYLEEIFFHEGVHSALDAEYNNTADWNAAQRQDPTYISTYAQDNPNREDLAESFLPYFAVRHKPDRISASTEAQIKNAMPNRIEYLDNIVEEIDMSPYEKGQ